MSDLLLTVEQAAERLGTTVRFPRRLIAERRIAFVKIGRHVRIAESVLNAYIDGNLAFVDEFLKERMPKVGYRVPEGTYIAWLDFRGYGLTPAEVHKRIYVDANVVLEDGEMFGLEGTGFQRMCVPSPRSLLQEALKRIAAQF